MGAQAYNVLFPHGKPIDIMHILFTTTTTTTTTTGCLVDGMDYTFKAQYPGSNFGAELSWDGGSDHPWASVEFHDHVEWKLESCGNTSFTIAAQYGCPDGEWCNAKL